MTEPKRFFPRIDTSYEPQDGDTLIYDAVANLWVPSSAFVSQVYSEEVLDDSPIAYWPMRDASGGVQDVSGNGNHCTANTGNFVWQSEVVRPNAGAALEFNGGNSKMVAPNVLDTSIAFSVEMWTKINATGAHGQRVFGLSTMDSGGGSELFWFRFFNGVGSDEYEDGAMYVAVGAGSGTVGTIESEVGDYTGIHHFVATMAAGNVTPKLYIDGVEHAENPVAASARNSPDGGDALGMGQPRDIFWPYLNDAFLMSDVAIYQSVLSAARVLAHYEAGQV